MSTQYKIGDEIWVAHAGITQKDRACRVCAGQRWITLITGYAEEVRLDCEYCARGYEAPTGRESYYEYAAEPRLHHVTGIDVAVTPEGEQVTYREGSDNCWHNFKASDCFPTHDAALDRAAELVKAQEAEQEANMARKEKDNKSYAWHAGYHLRNAKEHERQMEYHRRKAVVMGSLGKVPANV